jgi:hypothetical protein
LGAGSMGVRNTWPAIVRRDASMSAMVTLMSHLLLIISQMAVPLAQRPSTLHLPVDSEDSKDS